MINDLWTGFIIGLLATLPLGPIGVLCVQRTITKKFIGGYFSALGAATADTIYAAIALFAVSLIKPYIDKHIFIITILVGILIIGMGVKLFLSKIGQSQIKHNRQSKLSLVKDYLSVFFLTISNPAYFFILIGYFVSFGINGDTMTPSQHFSMILGVAMGACSWWFVLMFSVSLIRKKFKAIHIYYFNKVSGVLIMIFGIAAIIKAFIN